MRTHPMPAFYEQEKLLMPITQIGLMQRQLIFHYFTRIADIKMGILYEVYEAAYGSKLYDRYVLMNCVNPDHDDRKPSLLVYPDRFRCLSCDFRGKTEHLLLQLQSYSVIPQPQKQTFVRNPFNKWLRKGDLSDILVTAYQALKNFPQQGKYLRDRKLSDKLIKKLKCGYSEGFYLIPILDERKKPLGALARAGESIEGARYFVPKGQDTNLLFSPDWEQVNEAKEVFLTYGVFDSIAIHQCGKAAMSTTAGMMLHPSALQDFRKRITIVPDRGEEVNAKRLANKLGWRGKVRTLNFPYGLKDASDLHQRNLLQGLL